MTGTHTQMRMTEGPIGRQMIYFALPLFIGNLFQQLYNTADALIVGRLLGNEALAAVSGTGTLIFLLVSLFEGVAAGAGVVISRYFGSRDTEKMRLAIHTNVAFSLSGGISSSLSIALCATRWKRVSSLWRILNIWARMSCALRFQDGWYLPAFPPWWSQWGAVARYMRI